MTPTLIAYLVAMMSAWIPQSDHRYLEPAEETRARYASIAEDAFEASAEAPIFAGEEGAIRTAAIVLSVAGREGSYARRVDACETGGDKDANGRPTAWTLWQMHDEPGRPHHWLTCSSRKIAARAALAWIAESFSRCRHLELADRLSFYTDGACKKDWQRSRSRISRAVAYLKAHPYEGDGL